MRKTKTLKVNKRFRKLVYGNYFTPEIRMSGKWLEEIGLEIGDQVTVTIKNNTLSISKQHP